jgi:hypothetical protein
MADRKMADRKIWTPLFLSHIFLSAIFLSAVCHFSGKASHVSSRFDDLVFRD